MSHKNRVIRQVAQAILLAEQEPQACGQAIAQVLGVSPSSSQDLVKELMDVFTFDAYPSLAKHYLCDWLSESERFDVLYHSSGKVIRHWPLENNRFTCAKPAIESIAKWRLPKITTFAELADWLNLSESDLIWLSGHYASRKEPPSRCQNYFLKSIQSNKRIRLLEIPKPRLASVQRKILKQILQKIPVHPAACGFVKKRSRLDFVNPHVGKKQIIKFDLQNYFLNIVSGRVYGIFRYIGYPSHVSQFLTSLCTHKFIVPEPVKSSINPDLWGLYQRDHLPQGAPTSPALANLCTFWLDVRLSRLADSLGCEYSRYADDFAFSTDTVARHQTLCIFAKVAKIAKEEGFIINQQKSRVLTQAGAQRLTGLVVNEKVGVGRKRLKAFEAELYNCVKYGPQSQNTSGRDNYKDHLQGRLAEVIHISPQKAYKLAALFDAIRWD